MLGDYILNDNIAANSSNSSHIGARFNLIGNNGIRAAVKLSDTTDPDHVSAGTHNIRAHGVKEVGEVYNMRFLGSVFNDSQAMSSRGSQHSVHGRAHRSLIQVDRGAL